MKNGIPNAPPLLFQEARTLLQTRKRVYLKKAAPAFRERTHLSTYMERKCIYLTTP